MVAKSKSVENKETTSAAEHEAEGQQPADFHQKASFSLDFQTDIWKSQYVLIADSF